ncbi:hypothetical protein, partial [Acidomonas methanolica]
MSVLSMVGLPTFARFFSFPFRPTFPSIYRVHFVPGQRAASRRERKASAVPPHLFWVAFGAPSNTLSTNDPVFSDTSFPASGTPSACGGRAARMHDERGLTDWSSSPEVSP